MSLDGRLLLVLLAALGCAVAATSLTSHWPLWSQLAAGLFAGLGCGLLLGRLCLRRLHLNLRALHTGLLNLQDRDFSVTIHARGDDELARLALAFNAAGDQLRRERQQLYQRELMLDTVLQSSPTALLLVDQQDRILYANPAARQLLGAGKALAGLAMAQLLSQLPAALAEALAGNRDGLFTLPSPDEPQIWHLRRSQFQLNGLGHRLYLLEQLTRELARAEVTTWKKVIRLLSHELNNSLAPIASLAHSGLMLKEPVERELLQQIFTTIRERADHLSRFLQGYARFARLPAPQPATIDWATLVAELQPLQPFVVRGPLPERAGWADPAQLSQLLLNLLKNAHEAGSPANAIELSISAQPGGDLLELRDRGSGMSDQVLAQALLPFYSTKRDGTGLGLALCRDIVEAHDGRIRLANRDGGGLSVSLWLPNPQPDYAGPPALV